jgi:CBS domain-containing protein
MNILFFLTPKVNVGFVYSSDTVSEAAEKMLKYRFTTVPVINEVTGLYEGTLANDYLLREL